MVDYRKWDKLDYGSSDEEDSSQRPQLTTLDTPGRVTIGPQGYTVADTLSDTAPVAASTTALKPAGTKTRTSANDKNGGDVCRDNLHYVWTQDRLSVTVSIVVGLEATSKKTSISVTARKLSIAFDHPNLSDINEEMQYDIGLTGDPNNPYDRVVDWELKEDPTDSTHKVLEITFVKKSPIPGTTMWWRRVFLGDPEIDVTAIAGRSKTDMEASKNYAEAHRLFQEKVANLQPIEVDEN